MTQPPPGADDASVGLGALSAAPLEQAASAGALPAVAVAGQGLPADRALLHSHVERTLADFFGQPALARDLHFQDLVNQVVDALLAEASLQDTLQAACAELAAARPR